MKRHIYVSTGTMVGRVNGYNYARALTEIGRFMEDGLCSGLELMMLTHYYENASALTEAVLSSGVPSPVIHCEKEIGTMLSDSAGYRAAGETEASQKLYEDAAKLFKKNCEIGETVGARRMVLHLWGGWKSDSNVEYNIERIENLSAIADEYGIRLLAENVPSNTADPRTNWHKLLPHLLNGGFIFDTRFGKLHEQIEEILSDTALNARIEHIHISDFAGTYRDFAALRPILHPGEGSVDFARVAALLDAFGYSGTITLESPVMEGEEINAPKLRKTLTYLNEIF